MSKQLVGELEQYVRKQLHVPLRLRPWKEESRLPGFLRTQYSFYEGRLLAAKLLLLVSLSNQTVRSAKKHAQAVREYSRLPPVFVFDRITPSMRRELVAAGIPFVVPGSQLYLPLLGVSLRERFRPHPPEVRSLSPSAQVLILFALLNPTWADNTPTKAAARLGYTTMTMGRAVDQLEAAGLIQTTRAGRERAFALTAPARQIWEKAQPLLRTPVARRIWISGDSGPLGEAGHISGLAALARYSSLATGRVEVVALTAEQLAAQVDSGRFTRLDRVDYREEADLEIEVWSYPPELLSRGKVVDPLSLYLDLREDEDERVQSALGEMMRGFGW
jgi:DNA-binding MarR family transcriptional regulator